MALKTLDNFKAALIGGGARPNLFEVSVTFPDSLAVGDETQSITAPTTSTGNESLQISLQLKFLLEEEHLKLLEKEHLILGLSQF